MLALVRGPLTLIRHWQVNSSRLSIAVKPKVWLCPSLLRHHALLCLLALWGWSFCLYLPSLVRFGQQHSAATAFLSSTRLTPPDQSSICANALLWLLGSMPTAAKQTPLVCHRCCGQPSKGWRLQGHRVSSVADESWSDSHLCSCFITGVVAEDKVEELGIWTNTAHCQWHRYSRPLQHFNSVKDLECIRCNRLLLYSISSLALRPMCVVSFTSTDVSELKRLPSESISTAFTDVFFSTFCPINCLIPDSVLGTGSPHPRLWLRFRIAHHGSIYDVTTLMRWMVHFGNCLYVSPMSLAIHVNRRNPLFIPVHKDFSKFSN